MTFLQHGADLPVAAFARLPDPGQAGTVDELVEALRLLKTWAGEPSYEWVKDRVNAAWTAAGRPSGELVGKTTVVDCFRPGRRRLNADLVVAIVQALQPDVGYVTQWRQALRVISGQIRASAQVRVQDGLPWDLDIFTGRAAELELLLRALDSPGGDAVVCVIAGMAGAGKTRLAVRAAHLLDREKPFDRVLFVNLRGFHPDPAQPSVEPAAVLDGFLRIMGVPGQRIPHDLPARAAAYRAVLAGTRTLVLLDNAADEEQVRPLLPDAPGCPVLLTSRRRLTDLPAATQVRVDALTPAEARMLIERTADHVPVGADPDAAARIAERCGRLPLALGLVAGHIRTRPGWTLTDHADRLDERRRDRHLDGEVQLALDLSYRHLPADRQRLLRLAALHPGQDFDVHAAAALSAQDLPTVRAQLRQLCRDHLLQQVSTHRYTLHDLVQVYAAGRGRDDDPPSERRATLTRLFDHYERTASTAIDALWPAEARRQPRTPPAGTAAPALTDPIDARAWLDTERPTLVAVAAYTATHGWPTHTTRLSVILFPYLTDGHFADALRVHGHAHRAASLIDDQAGQARALTDLGITQVWMSRYALAAEHLRRALRGHVRVGDPAGQARALAGLGVVEDRLGHLRLAAAHYERALTLYCQVDDRLGEARMLGNLGIIEVRLNRCDAAVRHYRKALALSRQAGDPAGEACYLASLGEVEGRLGRSASAIRHLRRALRLYRGLTRRAGEAMTLDCLGMLYTRIGQPIPGAEHHRQALAIFREAGEPLGEIYALNGLGEATTAGGHPADAVTHHTTARAAAADIEHREELARAHAGLARAEQRLAHLDHARGHYRHALVLYTDLGMPLADEVRADLDALGPD